MSSIGIDSMEVGIKEWLSDGCAQKKRTLLGPFLKPNGSYEKFEDISPEVFEDVLFGKRESPDGWRCLRRSPEPPRAERDLWHQVVAKALSTGSYERVSLLSDELDVDVLNDLSRYVLLQKKTAYCRLRHVILELVSHGQSFIVTVDPGCIAIYA